MANSTQQLKYNKVSFGSDIPPDAPEGEWEMTITDGKVSPTKKGDPMVTFKVRLDSAADPDNEYAQGTMLSYRIIFFDDRNPKIPTFAKKRNKRSLHELCRQIGVEPSIVPDELNDPENDLQPLISTAQGKTVTGWTVNRKSKDTGETITDVQLSKPGSFTATSSRESDDED